MVAPRVTPAADQIVALFNFLQEAGNLFGVVLQIPVHGNDHVAAREIESRLQRGRLSKIPPQAHDIHAAIVLVNVGKYLEGIIAAAVVHKNQFVALADGIHHLGDFHVQRRDVLLLVEERDDDGISNAGFASHTMLAKKA